MTKNRFLFSAIICFVLSTMGCSGPQSDLDKLKLQTLDGKTISMDEFEGKRVFVNFWATWCKPCIQEMPTIAKARELLKDENVVFLFPSNESVDLIQGFKERKGFDFDYLQVQNLEALNIQALPTTFIYDENGKLIFEEAGLQDWSTKENLNLIAGKTKNP